MRTAILLTTFALLIILVGCETAPTDTILTESGETTNYLDPGSDITGVTSPTEETTPTEGKDPLESLLNSMTLEERVGQLFLVACPQTRPLEAIEQYHLGGLVLFGANLEGETPKSLMQTLMAYQESSKIPMLIAVDEEGGSVCRVSSYEAFRDHRFPSPRRLLEQGGLDFLLQTEEEKCQLLKSLGINVNLAPVCDISNDPNAFMYSRSMGGTPATIAHNIQAMVQLMGKQQIGSVLKHFPGYGNNTDTHVAMAVDNRALKTFEEMDLVPFQAGINAGCGAIMVNHTIVTAIDDKMPATLSVPVHQYLREKMKFDGIIMTDDLTMAAIADYYGAGEAAVLAVLAGNDVLCTWSCEAQYDAVLSAVKSGRISMACLDASVLRILRWKQSLGLLNELLK